MNSLHMAIAHRQKDIAELLLKSMKSFLQLFFIFLRLSQQALPKVSNWTITDGYDPNAAAICHCRGNCTATGNIPLTSIFPR